MIIKKARTHVAHNPGRRRRKVLVCPKHRPRRTELLQGPAPRPRASGRGVPILAVDVARQVRVAG